ncbi:two-component system response regulator YesN [Pullulanibacillus pueri]|uniref:DNA-binding response regulator n=1 Tax=Pullulanibacillus pueri TaxID=1437324 RepID=A0A8J2ZV14_9BACL|nr:response regulator [Pullulanibacillus pueri]MBM7680754.1 two-component system response regulator YesN [Pullulanibacillus pueri]GGH78203.1 hypothetical protein GCM10007096_11270 [Pullulanibacillus pueri]
MVKRLLIVDDEKIEREALKKMIGEAFDDLDIVDEAVNGRQAIEKAKALAPDIIMMDIKMPGIDGVEAVKQIRKERPKIKFIMVSAYNTFDYAKQVMREGVKEYLLKPSRKTEIIETVQRVLQEIETEEKQEKESQSLRTSYNKALSFVQSEWVSALLLDHVQESENEEWESLFNPEAQEIYALVCRLLSVGHEEALERRRACYVWIKQWFRQEGKGFVGPMSGEHIPVFVLRKKVTDVTYQSEAVQLAKAFLREFDQHFSEAQINVGMGTPVASANDFASSYNEALIALEHTNENVRSSYYHSSFNKHQQQPTIDFQTEQALITAVKNGEVEHVPAVFQAYFLTLEEHLKGDIDRIGESVWELWVVLSRMLKDMGISLPLLKPSSLSLGQLKDTARAYLVKIAEEISSWREQDMEGLLYQAKEYIDSHYTESLSLEDVANHVQLSPYYFSKLFKENYEMTYIEYLTKQRIEHAQNLLKTTELSQKEICYQVGYHDPNYFSRVFKKWTKQSPREYRRQEK